MSYENQDRRWTEEQFKVLAEKMSKIDTFMGQMEENLRHRRETDLTVADQIEELKEEIGKTNTKVDGLLSKINKWEAKLGSFMFIAGCLWAFFVAMKDHILAFVKG